MAVTEMPVETVATINAPMLCRRAGISYRQVDHWCRVGVLRPLGANTPGSGSPRTFAADEARVAAVVAELRELGASLDLCTTVAVRLRSLAPTEWVGHVFVARDGSVTRAAPDEACWLIRLSGIGG